MFHVPAHKQVDPAKLPSQSSPARNEQEIAKVVDFANELMAYEEGTLDDVKVVELFQYLIDSGLAWQLQGHYGRTAQAMIRHGLCQSA